MVGVVAPRSAGSRRIGLYWIYVGLLSIVSIFWLAVVASLVALVAATLIEEIPLRGKQSEGVVAEL